MLNAPVSSTSSPNTWHGRFSLAERIERLTDRREKVRTFLKIYPYDHRARKIFEDLSTQIDASACECVRFRDEIRWAETTIDEIEAEFRG